MLYTTPFDSARCCTHLSTLPDVVHHTSQPCRMLQHMEYCMEHKHGLNEDARQSVSLEGPIRAQGSRHEGHELEMFSRDPDSPSGLVLILISRTTWSTGPTVSKYRCIYVCEYWKPQTDCRLVPVTNHPDPLTTSYKNTSTHWQLTEV